MVPALCPRNEIATRGAGDKRKCVASVSICRASKIYSSAQVHPRERELLGNCRVWLVPVGKDERIMSINSSTRNTTATLTPKRAANRVILAGRFKLGAKVAERFRTL